MPIVSDRKVALRFVKEKLDLNIALHSSSSDEDFDSSGKDSDSQLGSPISDSDAQLMESSSDSEAGGDPMELEGEPKDLLDLYCVMEATRYFVERPITTKSSDFAYNFFAGLPQRLFRQMTRMEKGSFFALLSLIEDHPVFWNKSYLQQAPVCLQLAVTLDRLGHDGNGACLNHMIPTWGVSNGSLVNFTKRCFIALDDVLRGQIKWPDRRERKTIASEFGKKGFPNCVGLVDGTLIPLSQRPKESGECYYDRKCRYSVNCQVICDHRRKILFLFSGMPGSCADVTCLKRSSMWKKFGDTTVFSPGQYILGDSGYQNMQNLVCSFKRYESSRDKEDFNMCVAKCRVTNEHCIGVLKSRWFSLKEMRIQLNSDKDNLTVVRWIGICAKLHNFVISRNDLWTEEDQEIVTDYSDCEEDFMGDLPAPAPTVQRRRNGRAIVDPVQQLLNTVMGYALDYHRQPGGCLHSTV